MSKWDKGQSGNPNGRPKTAFKDKFDDLQAKLRMHSEGVQILSESWHDVVYAMVQQATKGNVQAAVFVRDTFIGKPKEIVESVTRTESVEEYLKRIDKEKITE
jgi:hypothetical protein